MYDLFIIGGGINGAGIARDAAGRGLKTGLAERDDLAAYTSSASTKLIHGGLRYLEHFEFRLVRESLIERERLLRLAPHIIWPMRFVLPHHKGLRPGWMLRLGLFLHDYIGGRKLLPPTKRVSLLEAPFAGVLKKYFRFGFAYSDCWVEDARLVVLNAMDAKGHGADIFTRTECVRLKRADDCWHITLQKSGGQTREVHARVLVNAAGPWVDHVAGMAAPGRNEKTVRLVKGSHIVTRRLHEGDHAFIFQNTDGRIVFAIPYEHDFTLIGTTDVAVDQPEDGATISDDEIAYLCRLATEYFATPVTAEDVVWSYAGVRPLFDDQTENTSKITRDYRLELDATAAPLLSIYGGKITTYRKLAEHALEKLTAHLPDMKPGWTDTAALPGGDIPEADFEDFITKIRMHYPWLEEKLLTRLARAYGTRVNVLLRGMTSLKDMGRHYGAGLTQAEIDYLVEQEFVRMPDDILWRRTKLGLHMTQKERMAVINSFQATPHSG